MLIINLINNMCNIECIILITKILSTSEIFTFITTVITIIIAYQTYKLQIQANNIELDKIKNEKIESVVNIDYFLNDIINKFADITFNFNKFDNCFKNSKIYYKDLYRLKNVGISEEEIKLLKKIFDLIDRYNHTKQKNIDAVKLLKVLYKLIIDTNFSPDEIYVLVNQNKIYEIISIKLLCILLKIRYLLTDNDILIDNEILHIKVNTRDLIIEKTYSETLHLEYNNGSINGYINRFEPVFSISGDEIKIEYQMIYEGNIKNGIFEGDGEYHYYSKKIFGDKLDSCLLCQKEANYDDNAQRIRKEFEDRKIDIYTKAKFFGVFRDGNISKGTIYYKKSKDDNIEEKIEIND